MLADLFKKPNDVFYMAEHHIEFQGDVSLKKFSRLMEAAGEGEECQPLLITIQAGRNREAGLFVDMKVKGAIPMLCQRCLQPIAHPIEFRRLFGLVTHELFADRLPEDYEPLLVGENGEEAILMTDLIEDEILLECPLVTYHENEDCNQYLNRMRQMNASDEAQVPEINKENPFSVLKGIKADKN